MTIPRLEIDREVAKADCIKYPPPTMGVDHSGHYKPNPYADSSGLTLAELTRATMKAFNIEEKE